MKLQELSLRGTDSNLRQAVVCTTLQRSFQDSILGNEKGIVIEFRASPIFDRCGLKGVLIRHCVMKCFESQERR